MILLGFLKKIKNFYILFFIVIFTSCVTPYQQQGFRGGFSETQLGENIFQVNFTGNGYTSKMRATDLALLRSAELTLQNDFNYFIIVSSTHDSQVSTYTTPTESHTNGNAYVSGNTVYGSSTTTTYPGNTYFIQKPSTINTIMMFKEKPEVNGLVYQAKFICSSIGRKYNVICN